MKASIASVVPMIPTGPHFHAALRFYVEHMGFRIDWQSENMAGIARDDICFNLVHNANKAWADNCSISLGVHGLENLFQEYRDIPAQVGPLEMKEWGRREFHMIVDSGVCFQFFEQESGATQ